MGYKVSEYLFYFIVPTFHCLIHTTFSILWWKEQEVLSYLCVCVCVPTQPKRWIFDTHSSSKHAKYMK